MIAWKISSEDRCWACLSQRWPTGWSIRGQEERQDGRDLWEAEMMLNNHGNEGNHF